MNIYVGNLDWAVSEADLEEAFAKHGAVESARVITDRQSGRSKGFGFVEMTNDDEAQSAIDELDGFELKGRAIKVNKAKPKTENRDGGGRSGGGGGGYRRRSW